MRTRERPENAKTRAKIFEVCFVIFEVKSKIANQKSKMDTSPLLSSPLLSSNFFIYFLSFYKDNGFYLQGTFPGQPMNSENTEENS